MILTVINYDFVNFMRRTKNAYLRNILSNNAFYIEKVSIFASETRINIQG